MASKERKALGTAGTTGGGAGMVIVFIGNNLPTHLQWLKPLVIYSAPPLSMLLAAVWLFVARIISDKAENYEEAEKIADFLQAKREIRDRACADPNCSAGHKEKMRKLYERYEQAALTLTHAQLKELEIKLES